MNINRPHFDYYEIEWILLNGDTNLFDTVFNKM